MPDRSLRRRWRLLIASVYLGPRLEGIEDRAYNGKEYRDLVPVTHHVMKNGGKRRDIVHIGERDEGCDSQAAAYGFTSTIQALADEGPVLEASVPIGPSKTLTTWSH
jgi:hypothetical protein